MPVFLYNAVFFTFKSIPIPAVEKQVFTEDFKTVYDLAVRLALTAEADALLLLMEGPSDWERIKKLGGREKIIVAADLPEQLEGSEDFELETVVINMAGSQVRERLTQALLECVAREILESGARVVAVYSGFEAGIMDSISVIQLSEHLKRLTTRDLRKLETLVPLDTLKTVVDLAVEIGRVGREGKRVGTLLVVGDTKKVLACSYPTGFDPVKGYSRKERNLKDRRVREAMKEIAQMDGAFVISSQGIVEASARYIDASAEDVSLPKGLGTRHWAAAAISNVTNAVAVAVSESNGTVRIFQNGEVMLRIEPLGRPMKWKGFELESAESE